MSKNNLPILAETGVIHGRFQILHNDHLKYLMAGKELCTHLVVGITNPDPVLTKKNDADWNRDSLSANPLTYYERYILIKNVLKISGLGFDQFSIVPFPVNMPELYRYYVPMDGLFFLTIYDDWGREKLKYFKSLGLKTHILWDVPREQKGISASEIRKLMINGRPWESMVPPIAVSIVKKWNISKRLKKIKKSL